MSLTVEIMKNIGQFFVTWPMEPEMAGIGVKEELAVADWRVKALFSKRRIPLNQPLIIKKVERRV